MLYKALRTPCSEWQTRIVRLSPEDVCLECLRVLDLVKEDPDEASFELRPLWTDIYNDLRQQAPETVNDEDVRTAADITFYAPLLMLSHATSHFYSTTLMGELTAQWQEHTADPMRIIESFTPTVARLGAGKLALAVDEYMESDEFLSDELLDIISQLDEPTSQSDSKDEAKTNEGQLSNQQLIILFEHFLNVSLSPLYVSIKAFATLIAKVSGRSAGSIRTRIGKDGIDYDSPQAKADVRALAELVRPVSEEAAQKILNIIED